MYYESLMVMTKQKTCNRKTNDKEKLVKAYSTKKKKINSQIKTVWKEERTTKQSENNEYN